tara:strand:+ start:464 stop:982 length:519 start_codon:yes stop_codon:yes gene_type:complete
MSTLKVTNLQKLDGTTFPVGKVGQVIQATKTDSQTFALATGSLSDVSSLTLNITPTSTSSKILVEYRMHVGRQSTNPAPYSCLLRDGTIIFKGDAAGSRQQATATYGTIGGTETNAIHTQIFLDSPSSTSALTYKIQVGGFASRSFYVNIPNVDSSATITATSTITAMEVLA